MLSKHHFLSSSLSASSSLVSVVRYVVSDLPGNPSPEGSDRALACDGRCPSGWPSRKTILGCRPVSGYGSPHGGSQALLPDVTVLF